MPGNWDGKSRPVNNKYRENYDDIFKSKTTRMARGKTVNRSSVRAGSQGIKKRQSDKKNNGTVNRQTLER